MSLVVSQPAAAQGLGNRSNVAAVTLVATKPGTVIDAPVVRAAWDQLGRDAGGAQRVSVVLSPEVRDATIYVRDARGRFRLLATGQPVTVCESASTCEPLAVEFRQRSEEADRPAEAPLRVVYHLQRATADGIQERFLPRELQLTIAPVRVRGLP